MEYSKKIVAYSWAAVIILTGAIFYGSYHGFDVTEISVIAGLAWGELTAAHAFYFWKAKNENRSKHAMQLVKDFADKYGIDSVVEIANVVLRE